MSGLLKWYSDPQGAIALRRNAYIVWEGRYTLNPRLNHITTFFWLNAGQAGFNVWLA